MATAALSASNSVIFALIGNLQDTYGFSDIGLGVIAATGFAATFVVQILVAPLADRGHVKHLLLAGTLCSIAGNLLFAAGSNLFVFAGARALVGAGAGCFLPAARAVMASISPTGAAERLGKMGGAELGGFVLGPVIGGVLVAPLGIRWPFVVFCGAALLSFVLVSRQQLPELPRSAASGRLAFDLLRHRRVLVAVLLCLSLYLPVGIYDALWDRFLTDRGASDVVVGLSLACYGIPFIIFAAYGGRLADRHGPVRVAMRSLWIVAPLTATYGLFPSPYVPIALGVVEAVVQAAASPAAQAAIAEAAPEGRATAAQGLAGATNVLSAAVMALLASGAYGAFGPELVFIGGGVGVAVCGLCAWSLNRGTPPDRELATAPAAA